MLTYAPTHLSDAALLRELAHLVARERVTTATLLAHMAEVDARRLYLPAGYPSMHAYCVEELHLSEDAAFKRIQAARAAREFPALFPALSEGRLHLAAVCLLAPHLTLDNVDELVEAASHRRKAEIEEFLARRFPGPAAPAIVRACAAIPAASIGELAPGRVGEGETAGGDEITRAGGTGNDELAPGQVEGQPHRAPLRRSAFSSGSRSTRARMTSCGTPRRC